MRKLLPVLLGLVTASPGAAGMLSFDEVAADNANTGSLGERYAYAGIHFHGVDDGASWDGTSRGDPGSWGIEGTNGSAFVGFNGESYGMTATFDVPVEELALDVAPSYGGQGATDFTLEGYRGGVLVERAVVPLGDLGEWSTVALESEIDAVRWFGHGAGFHPFGVDNLRWRSSTLPFDVGVEVARGTDSEIDPDSTELVGAVVLGAPDFDVLRIDASTLELGPAGATLVHRAFAHVRDVDGDGWDDLVGLYNAFDTGLEQGDDVVCLSGETVAGETFEGCDGVWVVAGE